MKIIYKNEKYLILKIIPEQELLETLLRLEFNNQSVAKFINKVISYFSNNDNQCWDLGNKKIDFTQSPLVMGILNVTPDSFSDGGLFSDKNKA